MVFDTDEWHAIYLVTNHQEPPSEPPPLNEMVRMIASFGGFINRKHDGESGPQAIWIGLQRARDFVLAINASKAISST